MNSILLLSVLIRVVALIWAMRLLISLRDWRIAFLAAMIALMALRQGLTLLKLTLLDAPPSWANVITANLDEVPGLIVSVLAFLSLVFLEKMIRADRDRVGRLATLNEKLLEEVAERKQIEGALREADASYRSVFENATEGIYQSSPDGQLLRANPALVRMNRYDDEAEMLTALTSIETGWYVEPQRRAELTQRLEEHGSVENFVSEAYRHKTGERFWISENAHVVRDGKGDVLYYEGTVQNITERKQAEDALQTSLALLTRAQQIAKIGYWVWDPRSDSLAIPSDSTIIVGAPVEELNGLSDQEYVARFVHPDDRERVLRSYRTPPRDDPTPDLEYRIIRPDGDMRYVHEVGEVIFDETGEPVSSIGILQDITELREREEALRESRAQLAKAQEMAKIGIWRRSLGEEPFEYWSEELYRILGLAPSQVTPNQQAFYHFVHPDDQERIRQLDNGITAAPGAYEFEYRILRADGEIRQVRELGEVERDGTGRVESIVGTVQDITDLKRTEEALSRSETRYRDLFDGAPISIWVEDWSGVKALLDQLPAEALADFQAHASRHPRVLYELAARVQLTEVSNSAVETFRATSKEAIRAAFEGEAEYLTTDDMRACFTALVAGFAGGQRRVAAEGWDKTYDHGDIYLRMTGTIAPEHQANWARVIISTEDITDRKRTEQALEESRAHLIQAQKMEAIGQLTGGVAHDFNNLLAVILGNLELLEERIRGDETLGELVRPAIGSARRGADLTHRLLAFSRRQPLQPVPTDVNGLLAGLTKLLHRTLRENIEIETILAAGLWSVNIDQVQLETAVLNLANNASDAMPGGGKLTIETANTHIDRGYAAQHDEVSPGRYVMVALTDSGFGMTPEVVERAFDPFFTTKDVGQGSGLGLSMVYGFVKQSGGHVKIYSEEGKGTTVKLYLPKARAGLGTPTSTPSAEGEIRGHGEVVLVVEDDPDVRELAIKVIDSLGYRVLDACDGPSALETLEATERVDLLFTDVVLPRGMSGVELAERATALRPGLKVLFASGYTENAILHNGILDEDVELIGKPFLKSELARRIRVVLDQEQE